MIGHSLVSSTGAQSSHKLQWLRYMGWYQHSNLSNGCQATHPIDLIHKSQNAHVPYPTMLHSEQKCAHFCSEWGIVGYGTSAFWDLWNWSIVLKVLRSSSKKPLLPIFPPTIEFLVASQLVQLCTIITGKSRPVLIQRHCWDNCHIQGVGCEVIFPDSKVHGANMGPTWVLSAPDGPHVVPVNLIFRVVKSNVGFFEISSYKQV